MYHTYRRDQLLDALHWAIRKRSEHEQHELKMSSDSGEVATWRKMYDAIRQDRSPTLVLIGEISE